MSVTEICVLDALLLGGGGRIAKIIFAETASMLDFSFKPRNRGTSKLVIQGIWVRHVKPHGRSSQNLVGGCCIGFNITETVTRSVDYGYVGRWSSGVITLERTGLNVLDDGGASRNERCKCIAELGMANTCY